METLHVVQSVQSSGMPSKPRQEQMYATNIVAIQDVGSGFSQVHSLPSPLHEPTCQLKSQQVVLAHQLVYHD